MILDELSIAASALIAQVATNLDNLAVLIPLGFAIGMPAAVTGYALSQIIMLLLALSLALGVDQALQGWAGYLGIVPVVLGCRGIWQQICAEPDDTGPEIPSRTGLIAVTALFLGMSVDSFSVMAPLIADSLPIYRIWVIAGAILGVSVMCGAAMILTRGPRLSPRWQTRLERLGPVAMIGVGLYVLMNTATDQI